MAGQFLVASASLVQPEFRRSIIAILNHDSDGTIGLIINRPTPVPLGDGVPEWVAAVSSPAELFYGGPVAADEAMALAAVADSPRPTGPQLRQRPTHHAGPNITMRPTQFQDGNQRLAFVSLADDPADVRDVVDELRIFAGYAGWGSGQLQAEIDDGGWHVVPGRIADVFSARPRELWQQVLRRQSGELVNLATLPDDVALN